MAVSILHQNGLAEALKARDLTMDTVRVMLMQAAHNPNQDDATVSAISTEEASGGTYSRLTLSNAAVTVDDANNRVVVDGDDLTFSSPTSGQDLIGAEVYIRVGADDTTPSDDPLVAFIGQGGSDVTAVDTTGDVITISGDQTGDISSGDNIQLHGHPTHDGKHSVTNVALSGGDTQLTVGTDLTDGTVAGTVYKLLTADGNNINLTFDTSGIGHLNT